MTQSQLARRLGVKKSTLVSWEDDVGEPRANRLSMLAGLLNVSIAWLLTGEGEGPDAPLQSASDSPDLSAILEDLRVLRTELRRNADMVALLEKRVRVLTHAPE
jgi:transcriptional regulator with XRE-family HTH domain